MTATPDPTSPDSPSHQRARALGAQLAEAHDRLRHRIDDLRESLADADGGSGVATGALALGDHCLSFCAALTAHHEGEDDGLFALLLRAEPALGPTLDKLVEDHHLISGILARVEQLASTGPMTGSMGGQTPDPATRTRLVGELDGMTAIMDSHFAYEERAITRALDGLPADTTEQPWGAAVFHP